MSVFALITLAISSSPALALDKVVLRINFTPWGMHAQYFGGRAQGFYKAEGIDLEIRPPAAGQQNEVMIATGREQFGLTNADAFVKAKGSGLPVVAVMADQPDNPFSVITPAKAGITTPEKMKGMKLAWFQANVMGLIEPVLAKGGLTRKDIEFVTVARGAEVQMLAAGQVDGLVDRIVDELGTPAKAVIATGGLAPLIIGVSETIDHHEPDLTLIGLRLIHERNA